MLLQHEDKKKIEIVEFPDLTGDKHGLQFLRELKFLILLILQLLHKLNPAKGKSPPLVQNITGEVTVSC